MKQFNLKKRRPRFSVTFLKFFLSAIVGIAGISATAQSIDITGPAGSGKFGTAVTVLDNGNYVITDPYFDDGAATDAGAVYLYNGNTHSLISTLTGSSANDHIGSGGITKLSNGNFLVNSPDWDNGAVADAGAVTWCDANTGIDGQVIAGNSLVGSSSGDKVGNNSPTLLSNGNYVINAPSWDNGAIIDAGAVTWCDGNTGRSGTISSSNSLAGSTNNDKIGFSVAALTNGNYVVNSPSWNNGATALAGAVTWCDGATGKTGFITSGNSLVGGQTFDQVGYGGIVTLITGSYVVVSPNWNNGANTEAGAVTWGNGFVGTSGLISSSNSLVGSSSDDDLGSGGVTALANGNYVVCSPNWNNGAIAAAGAVTWGNGGSGTSGVVNSSNSLVGSHDFDNVGSGGVKALMFNGNYVVLSPDWANGGVQSAGAATWGNGNSGVKGPITSSNSFVGSQDFDRVGYTGATALYNGNYVVSSLFWNNGPGLENGAVTWGMDLPDHPALYLLQIHFAGGNDFDLVGLKPAVALFNGNYVVSSQYCDINGITNAGAVTWGDGATGITGLVTSSNSLVGAQDQDLIGNLNAIAMPNGNYATASPYYDNGATADVGAVTWGNGNTGITGPVTSANSFMGSQAGDLVGSLFLTALPTGNFIFGSPKWHNGGTTDAGAVTFGNGNGPITGNVSLANSLAGTALFDLTGFDGAKIFTNGNYAVKSSSWNGGLGAITLGNGSVGVAGPVSNCNSVTGLANSSGFSLFGEYNYTKGYLIVGRPADNTVTIFNPSAPALATSLDATAVNVNGYNAIPLVINSGCRIIATLTPGGLSPIKDSVNAKVWIEPGLPVPVYLGQPYVARHYQVTPKNNAATATGRITFYFTQQEFTDFNADPLSTSDLPSGPADAAGKANLRVIKFPGTSSDGSGLPGSYSSAPVTIDPNDADIVWNNTLGRWEVSIDITGFSGFIVQTVSSPLPLSLLNFSAAIQQNDIITSWKTTNESGTSHFEVERSTDGRNFVFAGFVDAANTTGDHSYNFKDIAAAINFVSYGKIYYRLKMVDRNGAVKYSNIVPIVLKAAAGSFVLSVQPVPFKDNINISLNSDNAGIVYWSIADAAGRSLQNGNFNVTKGISTQSINNLGSFPTGYYLLKIENTNGQKATNKLIKE